MLLGMYSYVIVISIPLCFPFAAKLWMVSDIEVTGELH